MNMVLLSVAIWYGGVLSYDTQPVESMIQCLNVAANIVFMLEGSGAVIQHLSCEMISAS